MALRDGEGKLFDQRTKLVGGAISAALPGRRQTVSRGELGAGADLLDYLRDECEVVENIDLLPTPSISFLGP